MLAANGLYGHIQKNALKSVLLLAGFVVLVVLFWTSWCVIYSAVVDTWWPHRITHTAKGAVSVLDILTHGVERAIDRWWLPLVFAASWFLVAFMCHADMIRAATGARSISRKEEPKLYNLVENLAISAGLPMPQVEIIPSGALNAYAAGLGPGSATVCVTRGLMRALTEDELQAVLAHEMTHIKNSDVRLMVIATVFAGGLTLLGNGIGKMFSGSSDTSSDSSYGGNRWGRSSGDTESDNDGSLIPVLISIAIAVLFLALTHVFALLIKFAISRSREFMADAGAVELTKNPDALISALQKISGNDEIRGVSGNLQAMMISASAESLFATHPAIADRIGALQQFAGGRIMERPRRAPSPAAASSPWGPVNAGDSSPVQPAGAMGFSGGRATFGRRGVINS